MNVNKAPSLHISIDSHHASLPSVEGPYRRQNKGHHTCGPVLYQTLCQTFTPLKKALLSPKASLSWFSKIKSRYFVCFWQIQIVCSGREAHSIQLPHGVTSVPAEDFEHDALLSQDFPPLDVDFDGLPLTGGRHSRLLQHCCRKSHNGLPTKQVTYNGVISKPDLCPLFLKVYPLQAT